MVNEKGRFEKGDVSWKKGTKKLQDPNEIRKCKDCGQEKIVTQFTKGKGDLYRYQCKECRQKGRRTGKISSTRFQKGHDKGVRFQKGHVPWHAGTKGQSLTVTEYVKNKTHRFNSWKYNRWREEIKKKDGNKCTQCGSTNRLSAHHVVPWKINEELRFAVENGTTLCNSCHAELEGYQKGHVMSEIDKLKSNRSKLISKIENLIKDNYGDE